jgi:hypothetical protein
MRKREPVHTAKYLIKLYGRDCERARAAAKGVKFHRDVDYWLRVVGWIDRIEVRIANRPRINTATRRVRCIAPLTE